MSDKKEPEYPYYCPNHKKRDYPGCLKEAHNRDELEEKFGWRGDIPQSWCKKCRS